MTHCLVLALLAAACVAQEHAARALGNLRNPADVPKLIQALKHPDVNHRFYAAYALGEIKDPRATDALLQALRDPEWLVRDQAAWALREIQNPSIIEALKPMLKEKDADVPHITWLLQEYGAIPKPSRAEPKHSALVAHWSFDDGNTKIAKDVSGRATDGEIKGCTTADGKVGTALRFGKGKYVELGRTQTPSVAKTSFTIMAWIKPEAPTGVVVARGGAACGYSLYIKDGIPKFGIRRGKDTKPEIVAGTEKIGNGWTHLAGVVAPDRIELYVNGKLIASRKTGGLIPSNGGQGMEIGFDAGNSAAEITAAFEGIIDEVKQFNAALTPEEVARQCQ
ncbi:MAG: HEAT repeat domain-containing protein [Verrucomicrobiae bacterium]|nr:HEAT repeat domain-containing protein [Verrucomicrobiae bacterium]